MSLKYDLAKGHLTQAWIKRNPRALKDSHHAVLFFLGPRVYSGELQSSGCDILLFLESKRIEREPGYIDVANQYRWSGELMLPYQVLHSKRIYFDSLGWAAVMLILDADQNTFLLFKLKRVIAEVQNEPPWWLVVVTLSRNYGSSIVENPQSLTWRKTDLDFWELVAASDIWVTSRDSGHCATIVLVLYSAIPCGGRHTN